MNCCTNKTGSLKCNIYTTSTNNNFCNICKADSLRNGNAINIPLNIPQKSGCYKWWAEKSELNFICNILAIGNTVSVCNIEKTTNNGKDLYCIYVGKAVKLKNRIKTHLKSLRRSTLRRSVSALINALPGKYKNVDDFIDKLFVCYEENDVNDLEKREYFLINQYTRLLNIKENKKCPCVTEKLIKLRKKP